MLHKERLRHLVLLEHRSLRVDIIVAFNIFKSAVGLNLTDFIHLRAHKSDQFTKNSFANTNAGIKVPA